MNKISVVIAAFNSKRFIKSCIDSVFAQGWQDLEVIIVDNGSKDGTAGFIKENYSNIKVIENKENLGACKARNQGIGISTGDWILTLDCDVILEKDFFIKAEKYLQENAGMLQPKVLREDRHTVYSCGIYLTKPFRRFYDVGSDTMDSGRFGRGKYIFGPCCAAAFYKREMLEDIKEKTGYFDERFFFLVEDVDLAWRAQRKGYSALYAPEAVCYHAGNSSNTGRKIRQYLCFRNRFYAIMKNEGARGYLKRFFPALFYDLPRALYLVFTNPHVLGGIDNL